MAAFGVTFTEIVKTSSCLKSYFASVMMNLGALHTPFISQALAPSNEDEKSFETKQ